jgi:hypothetical protein
MTRRPSEAVDLTHLNPHLQEHLSHIGNPQLPVPMLFQKPQSAGRRSRRIVSDVSR